MLFITCLPQKSMRSFNTTAACLRGLAACGLIVRRYVRWHDVQGGLKSFLSPDTVALGHTFVVSMLRGAAAAQKLFKHHQLSQSMPVSHVHYPVQPSACMVAMQHTVLFACISWQWTAWHAASDCFAALLPWQGLDDEGSHVTLRLKRNDAAPGEEVK
jgi:hypothetical protein